MSKYTASQVADYFLFKAQEEGKELLSNLKLQRMVCDAQAFHLDLYGELLFDDPIEVREYGPVVPKLYEAYEKFGEQGIPADSAFDPSVMEGDAVDLLDEVYDMYTEFAGIRLMQTLMTTGIGNRTVWVG